MLYAPTGKITQAAAAAGAGDDDTFSPKSVQPLNEPRHPATSQASTLHTQTLPFSPSQLVSQKKQEVRFLTIRAFLTSPRPLTSTYRHLQSADDEHGIKIEGCKKSKPIFHGSLAIN